MAGEAGVEDSGAVGGGGSDRRDAAGRVRGHGVHRGAGGPVSGGRPKAAAERELAELVAGHLERFPAAALSRYELARALGLPHPPGNGRDRIGRALSVLEEQGRVVQVTGPADEHDRRAVTRWRAVR